MIFLIYIRFLQKYNKKERLGISCRIFYLENVSSVFRDKSAKCMIWYFYVYGR